MLAAAQRQEIAKRLVRTDYWGKGSIQKGNEFIYRMEPMLENGE